jgi:hypothetical protein
VQEWLPAPGWLHEKEHIDEVKSWWRNRRRELAGAARARRAGPARRRR